MEWEIDVEYSNFDLQVEGERTKQRSVDATGAFAGLNFLGEQCPSPFNTQQRIWWKHMNSVAWIP